MDALTIHESTFCVNDMPKYSDIKFYANKIIKGVILWKKLLRNASKIVVEIYNQFDASHDFAHIERVMKNAEEILA